MKVITNVTNDLFIKLQYYTLKKFMKNEYEFIVFNDAKEYPDVSNGYDKTIKQKIIDICNELNIKCYTHDNNYQQHIKDHYSYTHSIMLNMMHKYQLENPDKYLILDGDMFLIDYLDISKYSNEGSAILLQERAEGKIIYMWPGIVYLDMTLDRKYELLKWDINMGKTDTGGMTEEWLRSQINEGEIIPRTSELRWNKEKNYNLKNIYFIKHLWSLTWNEDELPDKFKNNEKLLEFLKTDKRNDKNKFFCELYDNIFLHYRGGGCDWMRNGLNLHKEQVKKLEDIYCN